MFAVWESDMDSKELISLNNLMGFMVLALDGRLFHRRARYSQNYALDS